MEQKGLKPWHGIVTFAVIILAMWFIAFPIQAWLGLPGVVITELMLLGMAIGAALLFKQKLKEVFPIKLPKLREILGAFIFWLGGFLLSMITIQVVALFFPEQMMATDAGLQSVITDGAFWFSMFAVTVLPAVCEEAVHRGFIQYSFQNVKKEWIVVLSMGVIFGIFHLDPMRFLPMVVLGGCMTWVRLKTGNMVVSSFYHLVNNIVPVVVSFAATAAVSNAVTQDGMSATTVTEVAATRMEPALIVNSISVYLMLLLVVPPLMLAGTALMKKKGEKIKGKHVAIVFIIAGALFIIGMAMFVVNLPNVMKIQGTLDAILGA